MLAIGSAFTPLPDRAKLTRPVVGHTATGTGIHAREPRRTGPFGVVHGGGAQVETDELNLGDTAVTGQPHRSAGQPEALSRHRRGDVSKMNVTSATASRSFVQIVP